MKLTRALAALLTALAVTLAATPAHAGAGVDKRCLLIRENNSTTVPEATFCVKTWATQSADRMTINHIRFWRASSGNNVKRVTFRYVAKDEQNDLRYASVVYDKRRKNGPLNFHFYPIQWTGVDAPATVQVRGTVYFKGPYESTVPFTINVFPVGTDLG